MASSEGLCSPQPKLVQILEHSVCFFTVIPVYYTRCRVCVCVGVEPIAIHGSGCSMGMTRCVGRSRVPGFGSASMGCPRIRSNSAEFPGNLENFKNPDESRVKNGYLDRKRVVLYKNSADDGCVNC